MTDTRAEFSTAHLFAPTLDGTGLVFLRRTDVHDAVIVAVLTILDRDADRARIARETCQALDGELRERARKEDAER